MSHVRGPYGIRTRTTRRDKPVLLPFNQRTNFDFPDYRELYWSCVKLITKKEPHQMVNYAIINFSNH